MTRRQDILGRGLFEVFPDNPDNPSASGARNLKASLDRVRANRAPDSMAVQQYDIRRPESEGGGFEARFWSPVNSPVLSPAGEMDYIIHRVEDVTEFVRLRQRGSEQEKATAELRARTEKMAAEIYLRAEDIEVANRQPLHANAAGLLAFFGIIGVVLLAAGRKDYPNLHTVLDTGACLLSAVLAMLFWDTSARTRRMFPGWLAISFAITALLEIAHVLTTVEWSGALASIVQETNAWRPATWPPPAHLLAIGIGGAAWMTAHPGKAQPSRTLIFAGILIALSAVLLPVFRGLPRYTPSVVLGITRPTLVLVPLLWAIVGGACWRLRAADRLLPRLALMAAVLFVAHLAMLYSRAPHDTEAMVAHVGKVAAYLLLLLAVMQMASADMLERIRAERALAHLNEELDRRVQDRTAALARTARNLENEAAERLQAQTRLQAQMVRLQLLNRITHATGERQDTHSILQVVVRTLEEQLPADLCCVGLHDPVDNTLTVTNVGMASEALAMELALAAQARISIDANGLSRCVHGQLVYEPDTSLVPFPFPERLAKGGLHSMVAAPLKIESQVFGVLIVARLQPHGFSSGDCEFLQQLSEHVALAAHQARLHAALQKAYDDLRQTQQAVMQQERLRALGQMASGIAHDINNAISPIALYTELLIERECNLSAQGREYLKTIQRAIDDVAATVARMREFYRQREQQAALRPVHLHTLVQQVVDLTRARWRDMPQQRGIVIDLQIDLAADASAISGVESEIREALTNLIFNAVDAMPQGGTMTLRTAATGAADAPRYMHLDVIDTGAGMDEHTRRRCLEPFFTTKGERGTGLGLAMVYGMMQRHGGDITIESEVGRGSTVRLSFPVPTTPVAESTPAEPAPVVTSRLRILVVDDDPSVLRSLLNTLESEGHTVVAAAGGQEGIDVFRARHNGNEAFSVVITDLGMPYIDGHQVASAVKSASFATPVIMLTGWGQRIGAGSDVPSHVDQVLAKPAKLRELRAALARCCARSLE